MLILAEVAEVYVTKDNSAGWLILLVIALALIFRYLMARMRHRENMAAIEKGLSLADLKAIAPHSNLWLKKMTFGIILSLIGPLLIIFSLPFWDEWKPSLFLQFGPTGVMPVALLFLGTVFFIIGVANLISARLQRKTEMSKTNTEDGGN